MKNAVVVVVTALFVSACCMGPRAKKEYEAAVASELARYPAQTKTYPAGPMTPRPWKVGQWTLSKVVRKGITGYERVGIVGQDASGWWVETVRQDSKQKSVTKVLFEKPPEAPKSGETPRAALDLVKLIITQTDGQPAQTIDMNGPQGQMMKSMLGTNFAAFQWSFGPAAEKKDVTVPAGTFQGTQPVFAKVQIAFITASATAWVHPAVPLNGGVRTEGSDGGVTELVAFGESGATSELR